MRGDVVEIYPSYQDQAYRIEFWGDEIDSDLDHRSAARRSHAKTHIAPADLSEIALRDVEADHQARDQDDPSRSLEWWEPKLIEEGKLVEAQRLHQRTMYDLEMMKEMGFCRGIENYSRHLTGKQPGEPPPTLLDYLPRDTHHGDRRIAPDHSAGGRHVQRRPVAQAHAGRIRLSSAVGAGQSPAEL